VKESVPARWNLRRSIAVAAGGIAGASLRWIVVTLTTPGTFPWPVLIINVCGSVLLGMLMAEEWRHPTARVLLHDGGGIGFCGGFTTFSTFGVEVAELLRADDVATATVYVLASVGGSIAGVLLGAASLRSVRALTLPLEERP
jgi:CrcB protein